jgi:hypothetical protein
MFFLNTSFDIINIFISYLNDYDNTHLIQACKKLYTYATKYGFVKYIKSDLDTNIMTFIQRFSIHSNTVKSVDIRYLDNPHEWLPHYVERICFVHCTITKYVNPSPSSKSSIVKYLKLSDYHRFKFRNVLRVNWSKFPNLEELDLYVYDVDLTGIQDCKLLRKVKINTHNGPKGEFVRNIK